MESEITTKKCAKCNRVKPLHEFSAHPSTSDKRQKLCTKCFTLKYSNPCKHMIDKFVMSCY